MVCAHKKEIKLFKHFCHVTAREDSPGLFATDTSATSAEESGFCGSEVGKL